MVQPPRGFTFKFAGAAAAPPAPLAPALAGARLAASRSALRRSWRDGGIRRDEQPCGVECEDDKDEVVTRPVARGDLPLP